jgi:glycosyltransferase involved in cell wall biosynthesis
MHSPSVSHFRPPREPSVGILSTFPPQLCGLATFAAALSSALEMSGNHVTRVALNDGHSPLPYADAHLVNGQRGAAEHAADVLSQCDVAIIQHEYGIFGGLDGDEVLVVLDALSVPSVVVLHTVPVAPTPHQRFVLEEVCRKASRVVVMTGAAGQRLVDKYDVDASTLSVIPHGATLPCSIGHTTTSQSDSLNTKQKVRLLTWGLLGPGKGIEHTISAIALVPNLHRRLNYTVAGVTHPNVFAREGHTYRLDLARRARDLGIAELVTFDETYRDVPTLMRFVASSSVVVLPYDSRDQVTSGVLVDAVAAGRPVIASAFPHAVELLSDGAGIIVPHGDVVALAQAIRSVVEDPCLLTSMTERATSLSPSLSWTSVAEQYSTLCNTLVRVRVGNAS